VRIVEIGLAVPERAVSQSTFAEWAQDVSKFKGRGERLIPSLYMRSGVDKRHSVLLEGEPVRQFFFAPAQDADDRGPTTADRMWRFERDATPLALRAAHAALGDERAITHLVTVSCSGFSAPGFDLALIKQLELSPSTERTHVGFMGCHGALNGLRVARAIVHADPCARVLLCAVELCTLHYNYGVEVEQIVSNGLFADGAAALLLEHDDADTPWRVHASGSYVLPDSESLMTWRVRDHGFEMGLSAEVPARIEEHLRGWLDGWLARQGLTRKAIGSWAIHPGGPRILSAVERALELPPQATADSRAVLAAYGNMSSPTLVFILDALRRRDAPRPCVALGFGPGLTAEAALLL